MKILTQLEEGRKRLNKEVAAQLEKEKAASLIEAKEKEGVMRCLSQEREQQGREEMSRIEEENMM
ncbi:unnamed protein product [Eruca vesicaria subsp. sativa]|uniref:Uncharacterized protein n=1 Tax=Eruca vesicaria subsp. sativa TaxID=29727 RepID=A0ABC8JVV4_ERUVS|nr:unnamed protein product [Eruca vesicaria subsp. sativa]